MSVYADMIKVPENKFTTPGALEQPNTKILSINTQLGHVLLISIQSTLNLSIHYILATLYTYLRTGGVLFNINTEDIGRWKPLNFTERLTLRTIILTNYSLGIMVPQLLGGWGTKDLVLLQILKTINPPPPYYEGEGDIKCSQYMQHQSCFSTTRQSLFPGTTCTQGLFSYRNFI